MKKFLCICFLCLSLVSCKLINDALANLANLSSSCWKTSVGQGFFVTLRLKAKTFELCEDGISAGSYRYCVEGPVSYDQEAETMLIKPTRITFGNSKPIVIGDPEWEGTYYRYVFSQFLYYLVIDDNKYIEEHGTELPPFGYSITGTSIEFSYDKNGNGVIDLRGERFGLSRSFCNY